MPRIRRPRALVAVGAVAALAAVVATASLAGCATAAPVSTVGEVDFANRLAIPPLAASEVVDGVRVFDLEARAATTEFRPGVATATDGYSGSYLGPTLRASRGEEVAVRVRNALDEVTTVHWHGMHLPAVMDGGPHQPIEPGATWTPQWQIDQPAATLWYHPHPHGETEAQVRRGLAGLFLVDDAVEAALPLPRDYGVDDLPLVVQDVTFDDHGQFTDRPAGFVGDLGDTILVNGTLAPYADVATDVVRLRLVNGSSARVFGFDFSDSRPFAMIASDGGLLDAPVALEHLTLSPGERAEVLVEMAPGERVVLRSEAPDLGAVSGAASSGGADRFDVLELRAASTLEHRGEVPAALAPVERLDPDLATRDRDFRLNGTQINQRSMDLERIDAVIEAGSTELWTVLNEMPQAHNFHVHDVQFQVLDIDGEPPPPELAGWKDTVYLDPGLPYRLILRFGSEADPDHPYMFHCHLLRHEDQGMMRQFLVVAPGDPALRRDPDPGSGSGHGH